ncbi:hypothetical protein B0A49_04958 [Cryomyces minteri]|uniref:Uncharacterized protein n=1 Tax=Cryomyces minteri TaxID=331657 RepID=A0A4V5NEN1_9PEZI|nr:hypothetical protein B0A49_06678 [Cryomyces minteri]TKA70845.1 hypothetical protein B0A49_04958 [Cryomyces minteri]
MPAPVEFPSFKGTAKLSEHDFSVDSQHWFDVKFYPYTTAGADPIFAVTGKSETVICKPVSEKTTAFEVVRWFHDDDDSAQLNSLVWTQDSETGDPLVCVTGVVPKIKILNVVTGELDRLINDLAISPISPCILASASLDHSIRLWNLDHRFATHPCAAIFSGGGHTNGVLTVAFHHTGRYIISGGFDIAVCLWVVPEVPDENALTDRTTIVHYPHFFSTEIHSDYVDCAKFYGDLILSRAAKEKKIVLWKIEGFDSRRDVPPPSAIPTGSRRETRSAFAGSFQRLLQFECPLTQLFYNRFGLFHEFEQHPILVMGNENSKLLFWDLQRLDEGMELDDPVLLKRSKKKHGRNVLENVREGSSNSNSSSGISGGIISPSVPAERKFTINDPFALIPAHHDFTVPKVKFCFRQIAWSKGGEWCVTVGDHGMICVLKRG